MTFPTQGQRKLLNLCFVTVLTATASAMLGIILYSIYALAAVYHGSDSFFWILDVFSDFVSIMNAALADSPYVEYGASYPPIAILVLYPFALICRGVFDSYVPEAGEGVIEMTAYALLHPQFWLALLLFFLLCTSATVLLAVRLCGLRGVSALKLTAILCLCAPFVYAAMRGNTIYFALIFLLLFLFLYEHPKPWMRELSYLCLVMAGAIKIYPLFFGVYLLKKKRFFAVGRIAVYTVLLFLFSFFLYRGDLSELSDFLTHLESFASDNLRLLSLRNLSIGSLLYKAVHLFSPAAAESSVFAMVELGIMVFLFLLSALTASMTDSPLSRSVIAAAAVVLIPPISYFYVLIFLSVPFLVFLREYDRLPLWKKRLYSAFFLFLFLVPVLLTQCFILHALVVLAMLFTEIASVFGKELLPRLSAKKDRNVG